jgi:hypothetical protein
MLDSSPGAMTSCFGKLIELQKSQVVYATLELHLQT